MPVLTAFCALGATLSLSRALVHHEQIQLQARTDAEAAHVSEQLRSSVLKSLDVLPQLAGWWLSQGRPASPEDWQSDAQLFLKSAVSLRQVVWLNAAAKVVSVREPRSRSGFPLPAALSEITGLAAQAAATNGLVMSDVLSGNGAPQFYAAYPATPWQTDGIRPRQLRRAHPDPVPSQRPEAPRLRDRRQG